MYKVSFLLLVIPLYCVILFASFSQQYLVAFGIFLSVLFINSFIIFSKKQSNFKLFFYVVSCSLLFPFALLFINNEVNIIRFIIVWILLFILFTVRAFEEFNIELVYLVCLAFAVIFNVSEIYLDLDDNCFICLIYSGLLHLICFPSFKKLVLFKPVKKSSKKSKKSKEE